MLLLLSSKKKNSCQNVPLPKLHLQPAVPFPHPTAHLKHFIAPAWSLYLSVPQVTFQSLFTDLESCLFMWFYRLFLNVHIVWCFSLALFAVWIWMISLTPYRTSPYSQSFLSYKGCWVKGKAVNVAVLRILMSHHSEHQMCEPRGLELCTFSGSRPETQQSYWCQFLFLMQESAWVHKIYF